MLYLAFAFDINMCAIKEFQLACTPLYLYFTWT